MIELLPLLIVGFVIVQRIGELVLAKRNTARLIAQEAAFEVSPGHYPAIVAVHTAWLGTMLYLAWTGPGIAWGWLSLFVLLQAGRVWVIASLGRYWTTRIIVVPGAEMVRRGPYRFLRHPNYVIVAGEIAALPLAFGALWPALVFSLLNALVLFVRVRAEETANAKRAV